MSILIVYDSIFGNTGQVAKAMADELERTDEVKLASVQEARTLDLAGFDLLLVGSPTRGFRPTPEIQEFASRSDLPKRAAVFDTRIDLDTIHPAPLRWVVQAGGYAAERLANELTEQGCTPGAVQQRGGFAPASREMFPAPDELIACRLLFGIYSSMVPDGIDDRLVGDVEWAGDASVLLSYVKGRTSAESVSLPRLAVRLLEQWLARSALLRGFADERDRGRLWLGLSGPGQPALLTGASAQASCQACAAATRRARSALPSSGRVEKRCSSSVSCWRSASNAATTSSAVGWLPKPLAMKPTRGRCPGSGAAWTKPRRVRSGRVADSMPRA